MKSFQQLGLTKGILDSCYLVIPLINTKNKTKNEILDSPRILVSWSNTRNEKTKYMVLFYLFFLLCTTTWPKIRVLIDWFRLFPHEHLIEIYGPLLFILSFVCDHLTKN